MAWRQLKMKQESENNNISTLTFQNGSKPGERMRKTTIPPAFKTYGLMEKAPPLVYGFHKLVVEILIRLNVIGIAIKHFHNPIKVSRVLKKLEFLRRQYMGNFNNVKLMKVDGRYYWDMHAPGWPSRAFNKHSAGEINRISPFREKSDYLNSMIFAITKKCPLQCEHCYEWKELNGKETLSLNDLKKIIQKFQERGKGVAQIQLSGGEPLSRFDDMVELLRSSKSGTDFWVVTSGYKLTAERAKTLKDAGLKGVSISLDHFKPEKHNVIRGSHESFEWVIKAISNAHDAKLVVILSLCATKEFITERNIMMYAQLAKKLGVAYILIIEPRAVGHFAGRNVALTKQQEKILEDFYLKMNYDPKYSDMPAVSYHGYHQRRIGCFGGGSRYIYVNTNGDLQVCPFCQQKFGNVLSSPIETSVEKMKVNGCTRYRQAQL